MSENDVKNGETPEFHDDTYQELKTDKEKIRTCLGMYISKAGTEGAMHLLHEIFNNAIDEIVNPHSPATKADVTFDEEGCVFTVTDNGRGIPFDKLSGVFSRMHTSTKYVRTTEWSKGQSGRNGVGTVVVSSLTDYMSVADYRDYQCKIIEFKDGELSERPISRINKDEHGLSVKFIPSEKYLGSIDITADMVEEYFRQISYVMPQDMTVNLSLKKKGDEKFHTRKYTYQGLDSDVQFQSAQLEFPPVSVSYISDNFDLLLSFSYDKTIDDSVVDSYCNYIHTTEGGTHEVAAQRAICDYFTREAKRLDPNNKFEVTYDDCKKGLVMCVNCRHVDPAFEGQHKSRASNKDVLVDGRRGLNDALYKYFLSDNMTLRKVVNYLRQIAKIRLEAHKIKGIAVKKPTNFLDDADIKGFTNISDRNYSGYKELLITEGNSASGAILNARNPKNQAVFIVFGVTNNVYGLSDNQLLQKQTFRNLVTILGCGIGKDFDINKLKYDRIIIFTDADVDGSNITSLLLCFFFLFMRPLIEEGKIYKAVPPLYLFDKKSLKKIYNGNEWAFDKNEYYDLFNSIVCDSIEIAIPDEDDSIQTLRKSDAMKWMQMNSEYLLELNNLSKRSACDPVILEHVCWDIIISMNNELKFKSLIEKEFDELKYDANDKSITGSYQGEFISLIVDSLFIKIAKRFMKLLSENPSFIVYAKNRKEKDSEFVKMTIGEFLSTMNSEFNVKIEQRFKGLGEADPALLFVTAINPKQRKLIRMTVDDVKEAATTFELLHARTNDMREERRNLLDSVEISYADIDN